MNCRFRVVTCLSHSENQPTTVFAGIEGVVAAVFFLKKLAVSCLFYIFLCCISNFSNLTFFCHKWYFQFDFDMLNNSVSNQKCNVTKGDVEVKKGRFCHNLSHNVTNMPSVNKVDCHTMSHFNGVLRCNEPELVRNKKQVCDKCDRFFVVITAKTTYNE